MYISERIIQNIFYYYYEIIINFFKNHGLDLKNIIPFSKEEILHTGRIDLIFEDTSKNILHAIEVQLGDADGDHKDRLMSYIKELKKRYANYKIFGYLLAEDFQSEEIINELEDNGIKWFKYSSDTIYNKYEQFLTKTEKDLGLQFEFPSVIGFARLEYFNGFFLWLKNSKNTGSFNKENLKENYKVILKRPSQIKDVEKTQRFKQILTFSECFNLVKKINDKGDYILTNLGQKYVSSLNKNIPWRFNKKMKNILLTSFLLRPFSSGIKLGIYNILKVTKNTPKSIQKLELYKIFTFLCGKLNDWKKNTTRKDAYNFYSHYTEELGLIKRTPEDYFYLTTIGVTVFKIYDEYYKTYFHAKQYLMEI